MDGWVGSRTGAGGDVEERQHEVRRHGRRVLDVLVRVLCRRAARPRPPAPARAADVVQRHAGARALSSRRPARGPENAYW